MAMLKAVLKTCFKIIFGLVAVRLCFLAVTSGLGGFPPISGADLIEYRDTGREGLEAINQLLLR
jgi:hypothetical protein